MADPLLRVDGQLRLASAGGSSPSYHLTIDGRVTVCGQTVKRTGPVSTGFTLVGKYRCAKCRRKEHAARILAAELAAFFPPEKEM